MPHAHEAQGEGGGCCAPPNAANARSFIHLFIHSFIHHFPLPLVSSCHAVCPLASFPLSPHIPGFALPRPRAFPLCADDLQSTDPVDYELRMVMWNTREVRKPEEKDRDDDVDQKIFVTTNFDGTYGGDVINVGGAVLCCDVLSCAVLA